MDNPLVSIIIPVFNGERHIGEALESVRKQTYKNIEIIVVDDGSTDNTAVIAEKLADRCICQENRGVAAARNAGIEVSKGEYLAFLDADDIWDARKLEKQIDIMESKDSLSYTFTDHKLFLDGNLEEFPGWIRKDYKKNELTGYIPSTLVARKRDFKKIGYFDETLRLGEDSDWFLRARDLGFRMEIIHENLLMKRVHDANLTANTSNSNANLIKVIKNSMMRKKKLTVSVVIPVYNGEKYLSEAVESVLNQSFKPTQVIVVDDGSTDGTEAVCSRFADRIIYLKKKKGGAASARNLGIEKASGVYLAFLDADDIWLEDRLRNGILEMIEEEAPQMIFGMIEEFYSPDTDEDFRKRCGCATEPTKGLHLGTMLIRKEDFISVGALSTEYETGEFIDWFKKAEEKGLTYRVVSEVFMRRRIHYTNHGIVHKKNNDDYAKIIVEMMRRRKDKKND